LYIILDRSQVNRKWGLGPKQYEQLCITCEILPQISTPVAQVTIQSLDFVINSALRKIFDTTLCLKKHPRCF